MAPYRVAVIGCGWSGLQSLNHWVHKYGCDVESFEQLNDVGGTWHPDKAYHGLHLHTVAKAAEFAEFQAPEWLDQMNRESAPQMHRYLRYYVEQQGLRKYITVNADVIKITYDSTTQKSSVFYRDTATKKVHERKDFDFVLNCVCSTIAKLPDFPKQEKFQGEIVHAYDVNTKYWEDMVAKKKKVIVLGAGKSAMDMLCNAVDSKAEEHITWLFRKSYWYIRHLDPTKEKGQAILSWGLVPIIGKLFGPFAKFMAAYYLNAMYCIKGLHFDINKFKVGNLCKDQYKKVNEYPNFIRGDIKEMTETGILTKMDEKVDIDVLLCCTGAQYIFPELVIDGKTFDPYKAKDMYFNCVFKDMPRLAIYAYIPHFLPGPERATMCTNLFKYYLDMLGEGKLPKSRDFLGIVGTPVVWLERGIHMKLFKKWFNWLTEDKVLDEADFYSYELKWYGRAHSKNSRLSIDSAVPIPKAAQPNVVGFFLFVVCPILYAIYYYRKHYMGV